MAGNVTQRARPALDLSQDGLPEYRGNEKGYTPALSFLFAHDNDLQRDALLDADIPAGQLYE
jgi:hypothetical protein